MSEELQGRISTAFNQYRRICNSVETVEQNWPGLTEWISRNQDQYDIGREVNDNAPLRLAQWYITYKLLFPDALIPAHPCKRPCTTFAVTLLSVPVYDSRVTDGAVAGERLMVIVESVTRSTLQERGLPAANDHETMIQFVLSIVRPATEIARSTSLSEFNNSRPVSDASRQPLQGIRPSNTNQEHPLEGNGDESLSVGSRVLLFGDIWEQTGLDYGWTNSLDMQDDLANQ
jgi:hypothetical protein